MERDVALAKISALRPELTEMGVHSLSVFGSVARGEAAGASDIDVLVEFDVPSGSSTSSGSATSSAASLVPMSTW